MKRLFLACLFSATLVSGALVQTNQRYLDTTGAWHDASEWRDSKAVVLFFISIDCPISNSYIPEMQRIHDAYSNRGVRF